MINKGILLIAAGHPYYGKMSAALAATIKASLAGNNIPIHLSYTPTAIAYLSTNELALFSSKAEIPTDYYMEGNNPKYIYTKLFLDRLSPFEKTIFLDSDLLWLDKDINHLFKEFDGAAISYQNYGFADFSSPNLPSSYTLWADINEVKEAYKIENGRYYNSHSEVFYFEKNATSKAYFSKVRTIYSGIKKKLNATSFAGAYPDELALSIASALLSVYPHKDNFSVSFWGKARNSYKHLYEIAKDYYCFSMAGNSINEFYVEAYNNLVAKAYKQLGISNPYKWKNKKTFLTERKSL